MSYTSNPLEQPEAPKKENPYRAPEQIEEAKVDWRAASPQDTPTYQPHMREIDMVAYVLKGGRSEGQIRPGFVVRAWGGNSTHGVNLQVLTDGTNDFLPGESGSQGLLWATSVHYSKEYVPGTYHLIGE